MSRPAAIFCQGYSSKTPFARARFGPHVRPSWFLLRLPDGTCASVVGGTVTAVWAIGEQPPIRPFVRDADSMGFERDRIGF